MVLSLSACSSKKDSAETKSLYTQGLEIVQLMAEMTQTEEYVDIHTGSSEIKTVIQNISTGDYTAPKAVYLLSVTEDNLAAMAELGTLEGTSEGLKTFLMQRVLGSLMTQINGMSGVENLAAASVCTVGKTFVDENATEDVTSHDCPQRMDIRGLVRFRLFVLVLSGSFPEIEEQYSQ